MLFIRLCHLYISLLLACYLDRLKVRCFPHFDQLVSFEYFRQHQPFWGGLPLDLTFIFSLSVFLSFF